MHFIILRVRVCKATLKCKMNRHRFLSQQNETRVLTRWNELYYIVYVYTSWCWCEIYKRFAIVCICLFCHFVLLFKCAIEIYITTLLHRNIFFKLKKNPLASTPFYTLEIDFDLEHIVHTVDILARIMVIIIKFMRMRQSMKYICCISIDCNLF